MSAATGGLDLFDHQLNFDEYCTTVTEVRCHRIRVAHLPSSESNSSTLTPPGFGFGLQVARNEAAFPATRKFWLAMESRLQLAQAIGLLRQD